MELMMREIRDNMKQAASVPVTQGQVQPRAGLVSPAPPATDRHTHAALERTLTHTGQRATESGQAQPWERPLGHTGMTQPRALIGTITFQQAQRCPRPTTGQHSAATHGRSQGTYPHTTRDYENRDCRPSRATPPLPTHRTHGRRQQQAGRYHTDTVNASGSSTSSDTDTDVDSCKRRDDYTDRRLINRAMARQYQNMGHSKGRVCDIVSSSVRPHEALPPEKES